MSRKLLSVFVAFLFVLSGCQIEDSADVNQDKIWAKYKLVYNATDSITLAIAEFRFKNENGEVLQLNNAASVLFNNQQLVYNEFYNAHSFEFNALIDSGSFAYTDLDQFTFTNTINGIDSIGFAEGFDTIMLGESITIDWLGNALSTNEVASLYNGDWSFNSEAFLTQTELNATSILVPANIVSELNLGTNELCIEREKNNTAQQATAAGGKIVSKYLVTHHEVEVIN